MLQLLDAGNWNVWEVYIIKECAAMQYHKLFVVDEKQTKKIRIKNIIIIIEPIPSAQIDLSLTLCKCWKLERLSYCVLVWHSIQTLLDERTNIDSEETKIVISAWLLDLHFCRNA